MKQTYGQRIVNLIDSYLDARERLAEFTSEESSGFVSRERLQLEEVSARQALEHGIDEMFRDLSTRND